MSFTSKFESLRQRQAFYDIPAGSDTSNIFKSPVYVDFFLNNMSNQLDQCNTLTLQFQLKNTTPSSPPNLSPGSVSVVPSFNFVELIEFYFNNDLLDSLRYDHLLVSHSFLNGNNTNNYGNLEGFTCNDNSNAGGITANLDLGIGESRTYYIPIPNNVFCTKGLLLSALKGQIKLRVYFRKGSDLVYNVVTPVPLPPDTIIPLPIYWGDYLNLENIQILSSGIKYKDAELARSIITDGYVIDTLAHRWGIKNLQKLDNAQQYDVPLEMLKGSMEFLFFYLKKSGASKKDLYQGDTPYYYDIKQLQLVDSEGTNTGFYSNMQSNFIKSLIPTQSLNSEWLSLFSLYMIPFATDPDLAYDNNAHVGNESMDGKSYFRFQPNIDISLVNDNMNLVVIGYQDAKLYIKNGVLSIQYL